MRQRLTLFAAKVTEETGAQRVLLGDAQGYCLYDGGDTEPQILASAVMLSNGWTRCLKHLRLKEPGTVSVGLGHGYRLIAMPCETKFGTLTLALISNKPFDDGQMPELRAGLEAALGAE